MRKLPVEEAVGLPLGHDITEIRAEKNIKHRAFQRGHVIRTEDIERLKDLGKFTVFVEEENEQEVHEDDAARLVSPLVAGPHIDHDGEPSEGKIIFRSNVQGLFQVDTERLFEINRLGIPALPTIPTNFPVEKGQTVAAFRIVPLTCHQEVLDAVIALLPHPLMKVVPYQVKTAAVLVTGNEVYEGRIKDGFIPRIEETLVPFGVDVIHAEILPDERGRIAQQVKCAADKADMVFVTGGTSVDPDDVTVAAMRDAGLKDEIKGMPLQPGNNFTIGYIEGVTVCAVPAATLFHRATAMDLLLPRLLAGQRITRDQVARMGHGGLALKGTDDCFPNTSFGRGGIE